MGQVKLKGGREAIQDEKMGGGDYAHLCSKRLPQGAEEGVGERGGAGRGGACTRAVKGGRATRWVQRAAPTSK